MAPDPHVTSQLASLPLGARLWSTLSANLRTSTAESLFFCFIFFLRKGYTLWLVRGSRHWWGWVRDGACEGMRSPLLGKQSNTEAAGFPQPTPHHTLQLHWRQCPAAGTGISHIWNCPHHSIPLPWLVSRDQEIWSQWRQRPWHITPVDLKSQGVLEGGENLRFSPTYWKNSR